MDDQSIKKYVGALGIIGVLMVVFYGTGIYVNFKRINREKLEIARLKRLLKAEESE